MPAAFFLDGQSFAEPVGCPKRPGRDYFIHRTLDPAQPKIQEIRTFQCVLCGHLTLKSVAD